MISFRERLLSCVNNFIAKYQHPFCNKITKINFNQCFIFISNLLGTMVLWAFEMTKRKFLGNFGGYPHPWAYVICIVYIYPLVSISPIFDTALSLLQFWKYFCSEVSIFKNLNLFLFSINFFFHFSTNAATLMLSIHHNQTSIDNI